jgi:hypothetical protein
MSVARTTRLMQYHDHHNCDHHIMHDLSCFIIYTKFLAVYTSYAKECKRFRSFQILPDLNQLSRRCGGRVGGGPCFFHLLWLFLFSIVALFRKSCWKNTQNTPKNRQASLFLASETENLLKPRPAPPPKKGTCNYWHGVVDSAHTNRKLADGEAFCRFCISDKKFQ